MEFRRVYSPKVLLTGEFLRDMIGAHSNERSPKYEKICFNYSHPQPGLCLPDRRVRDPAWCCDRAAEFRSFDRYAGRKFWERSQPCVVYRWKGRGKLYGGPKLLWLLARRTERHCSPSLSLSGR